MLSPRRVEFPSLRELIVESLRSPRRRPRRPRFGQLAGQTEVAQDPTHYGRLLNQRHEAQPPSTAWHAKTRV